MEKERIDGIEEGREGFLLDLSEILPDALPCIAIRSGKTTGEAEA